MDPAQSASVSRSAPPLLSGGDPPLPTLAQVAAERLSDAGWGFANFDGFILDHVHEVLFASMHLGHD